MTPSLRRVVAVLCVTEIVSWGVLYYAFPVLAGTLAAEEDWPLTSVVAAFTVGQLVAAGSGIWVGRHIDVRGPRRVMTAGSALGVASVVGIALAPSLAWFAVAWAVTGAAMAATLYPPAFAAITHWAGPRHRVRALTALTLVAGLASTVFAPLTAWLESVGDWRQAYLVLAVVLALTVPLHAWGLRGVWPERAAPPPAGGRRLPAPLPRDQRTDFRLLVLAMTLAGFSVYAVVINLVPLLVEGGMTTARAALALGLGGVGQVVGRLFYAPMANRLGVRRRTVVVLLGVTVTTAGLALVDEPVVAVLALSFLAGSARGIYTLIQATAVADRWGTASYGARNGLLAGAVTAAAALAPWGGTALAAGLGGYAAAFLVLAAVSGVAALLVRPVRPVEACHHDAWVVPAERR